MIDDPKLDSGTLSVVIPVYNEAEFILPILRKIQEASVEGFEMTLVVVDDGSTDGTRDLLAELDAAEGEASLASPDSPDPVTLDTDRLSIFFNEENRGKGFSLRKGFAESRGDVVVVQDADLEYDPEEYSKLIEPIRDGKADVVYGSRFLGGPQRAIYYWHYMGNRILTDLSNMLTNLNLTDMETCYKMFRREVLESIELGENRFGIEPEITAKVARAGYRVYEVPISYYGRTYEEGKKITWLDGVVAVWCIFKYNLLPWT